MIDATIFNIVLGLLVIAGGLVTLFMALINYLTYGQALNPNRKREKLDKLEGQIDTIRKELNDLNLPAKDRVALLEGLRNIKAKRIKLIAKGN